ncbi:MAG TPA: proton-conducting transporter membrane subunit, partial [Steroidobacteraceae bacterium]|nr:proton-conducting transporter membrane subunit [Steroidobacteraceae bacterium]
MEILVLVLLPALGALVATSLARASRRLCASVCGLLVVAALAWLGFLAPVALGEGLVAGRAWMPEIGVNLYFRLDGLAFLFATLILAVGLLIVIYSHFYLRHEERYGTFFAYLMLFMSAMLGIVLSENILLLSVFWELTSISSFLLIGFHGARRPARVGAVTALTVTAGGGLALLAGLLLLGYVVGSFELSDILAARETIAAHGLHLPILVLVLLGVFTKSAQFPFHFWLPPAMAAPTPVSAYLHSAAMVNAGIFLLARLHPALAGDAVWLYLVAGTGMITFVFGAFVAMFRHDVKSLLAYSTISHLGLIVFLLGLGDPLAVVAGLLHVVNHATFKASLFMAAGIVSHESGSRDARRLAGLWREMPRTAVLAAVATASMAGVPLLNGFISKEMFFSEALAAHRLGGITPVAALAFGIFSVAYS